MSNRNRLALLVLLLAVPASAQDSICLSPQPVPDGAPVIDDTVCYCSTGTMTYDDDSVKPYPRGVQPMVCEVKIGDRVVDTRTVEPNTEVCIEGLEFYHPQDMITACLNEDGGEGPEDVLSRTFRDLGKPGRPVQIR